MRRILFEHSAPAAAAAVVAIPCDNNQKGRLADLVMWSGVSQDVRQDRIALDPHTKRSSSYGFMNRRRGQKQKKNQTVQQSKTWKAWQSLNNRRNWNNIAKQWEQYDKWLAYQRSHFDPRDAQRMTHVYAYMLPVFADQSSVLQMRDRDAYHVGLFGGEVELWKKEVRRGLCGIESGRSRDHLPCCIVQQAQKELLEEAGLTDFSLRDAMVVEKINPRTRWRSVVVLMLVDVDSKTCQNFRQFVSCCLSLATDLGKETLTAVPVRTLSMDTARSLNSALKFQKHHFTHFQTLLQMHKMVSCEKWIKKQS